MKKLLLVAAFLGLTSCGYSNLDSTFTGQIKYVENVTPLMCMNYTQAGISLGVMRNGTGSVSTHDVQVYVPDAALAEKLKEASVTGKLMKITYNELRLTFCVPSMIITKVEVVE